MIAIKVMDKQYRTVAIARGDEEVSLVLYRTYEEGDFIFFEMTDTVGFLQIQYDDAMGSALQCVKKMTSFKIPFNELKASYSPKAFSGEVHLITARYAKDYELRAYRNLALNPYDFEANRTAFPHASSDSGATGVFAARNAIDGIRVNQSHNEWPYCSWGINKNPDSKLKIDFGHEADIDKITLYIRFDMPHDNYWEQINVNFSDGEPLTMPLEMTDKPQTLAFETRRTTFVELSNMVAAKRPSLFPALSQIEIYGNAI